MTRRAWIVLAAASLAAAAACLYTALRPAGYRADVELVVARGNAPLDPSSRADRGLASSLRELVRSHVLAESVVGRLHLRESSDRLLRRISASTPQPAVVRIGVTGNTRSVTLRIASEVGLVFTQLVQARFGARGSHIPVRATLWDAAHAERLGKTAQILESGLLAALVGALVGLGLSAWGRRRRPARPAVRVEPIRPLPRPKPAPRPEPEPELPPAAVVPLAGNPAGNVLALERLVEARAAEYPDRAEEWRYYVVYLRDFAEADGALPDSLAGLVADVFGDLLPRAA